MTTTGITAGTRANAPVSTSTRTCGPTAELREQQVLANLARVPVRYAPGGVGVPMRMRLPLLSTTANSRMP